MNDAVHVSVAPDDATKKRREAAMERYRVRFLKAVEQYASERVEEAQRAVNKGRKR